MNTGADRSAPFDWSLVYLIWPGKGFECYELLIYIGECDRGQYSEPPEGGSLIICYSIKKHIFTPATSISSLFLSSCADEPISLLFTMGLPVLSPPSI